MSKLQLLVKKLTEHAVLPQRGSAQAAGYDLSSAYDVKVPAHGKALVKTDLAISLPEGVYGRVAPRSGLAWKSHIDVGALGLKLTKSTFLSICSFLQLEVSPKKAPRSIGVSLR